MVKKLIEVKNSVNDLFFLFRGHSGAATCSATSLRRDVVGKEEEKEAYPPAGFSLQDFPYRDNYPCEEIPARIYLQAAFAGLPGLSFFAAPRSVKIPRGT